MFDWLTLGVCSAGVAFAVWFGLIHNPAPPKSSVYDVDWPTVAYCMDGRQDPYDSIAQKAHKLEYCVVFEGLGQ